MAKKKEEKKVEMTRAQKTEATKGIIKELLSVKPIKHNELIEETARLYIERYKSEETENVNDVKGRVGSVLDIMKKESEVMYDGGMYALKARMPIPAPTETTEEKPAKKPAKAKAKKTETKAETPKQEEVKEEQPTPKKKASAKKTKAVKAEETTPAKEEQPTPIQEEKTEEKPAPKKRGRKTKATVEEKPTVEEQKAEEMPIPAPVETPTAEEKTEEVEPSKEPIKEETKAEEPKKEEPKEEKALTVKPKGEVAQKGVVMDMSFLIGNVKNKPAKAEEKPQRTEEPKTSAKEEKKAPMSAVKEEKPKQAEEKKEVKTVEKPTQKPANKPAQKSEEKPAKQPQKQENKAKQKLPEKQLSADEKLREAYLKRIRSLGGDYFEYYSVYLLERYSMRNGRRLEMLKISGGDRDGGIDGEIELTDKFGFKETIYIQSKNWDPDKGKEEYWTVGETLLQQFIGACACKQAKQGKQHCRGIFVTTSRFTPEAKRILDDMSDKIVGYDGNDLYETAKECAFGLVQKNGEWALDEKLLSGTKAFFNML